MADIKNSSALEKVFQHVKELVKQENPSMTAERFLVALFDIVTNDYSAEIGEAKNILLQKISDFSKARSALASHLETSVSVTVSESIYMQKKIYEAKERAAKCQSTEITVAMLLNCILEDPSQTIKNVFSVKNEETERKNKLAEEISRLLKGKSNAAETAPTTPAPTVPTMPAVPTPTPAPAPAPTTIPTANNSDSAVNNQTLDPSRDSGEVKSEIADLVSDVKRIRKELQAAVYGQDNAINVFVTGYFQASMRAMMDDYRKRPLATFLFAGHPGVGKTFLAEKAAETLKLPFMRFDMSEYADKEANLEFCGSDKVYKNGKAGNVTSFVAENPKCILLFDEIEKAHITVIHLFLQMLDAGRLRDNYTDQEVSFSDAIIILTTNAGKQLYDDGETIDFSTVSRKVIIKALQKDVNPETGTPFFPGAICSRFASGNVVMFNHIGAHNLRAIAKKEIERYSSVIEKGTNINVEIDDRVYTALLFAEGSAADARTVRGRAETFFNDELYELLRLIASEKVSSNISNIERIQINVDLSKTKEEISKLFVSSEKTQVLVFSSPETVELCKQRNTELDIIGVQNFEAAVDAVKNRNVDFILLDMLYNAPINSLENLNIEDVESPARDFFKFMKEQRKGFPIFLVEQSGYNLSDEEKISFMRQGVRGVVNISYGNNSFATELKNIAASLYQQASMIKLAKENKLISFETAQTISMDGKNAEIKLFDFEMRVAVDSEDAKNVLSAVSKPDVHFNDVIGARDAKQELMYFVEYLKDPKKYMGTGVKAPKGVVLYGPPGTGKTMLAKAMACEAGVTFIAAEGNQFLKKYVGEGSEMVHDLFRTARKYAPSVLFIDEIDAIAKERKGGDFSSSNGEATLTAFLTEMDGFVNDPSKPVFVLAATNFDVEPGKEKSLDPALMRRFDRRVYIELPNKDDRIAFLRMKIEKNHALKISQTQIENIAMRATGMSLAELDSAVELALRSAIRQGSTVVNDEILEEAFETFNNGETKKWDVSQLERVARHEAGHALLCYLGGETPSYLTIVARGDHGGYMQHADQEGKALYTKDELLARIKTSLGGRAAEIVYYGERDGISTGASGDLASATRVWMMSSV